MSSHVCNNDGVPVQDNGTAGEENGNHYEQEGDDAAAQRHQYQRAVLGSRQFDSVEHEQGPHNENEIAQQVSCYWSVRRARGVKIISLLINPNMNHGVVFVNILQFFVPILLGGGTRCTPSHGGIDRPIKVKYDNENRRTSASVILR